MITRRRARSASVPPSEPRPTQQGAATNQLDSERATPQVLASSTHRLPPTSSMAWQPSTNSGLPIAHASLWDQPPPVSLPAAIPPLSWPESPPMAPPLRPPSTRPNLSIAPPGLPSPGVSPPTWPPLTWPTRSVASLGPPLTSSPSLPPHSTTMLPATSPPPVGGGPSGLSLSQVQSTSPHPPAKRPRTSLDAILETIKSTVQDEVARAVAKFPPPQEPQGQPQSVTDSVTAGMTVHT